MHFDTKVARRYKDVKPLPGPVAGMFSMAKEIVLGKRRVTAETALRLALYFDTTPQLPDRASRGTSVLTGWYKAYTDIDIMRFKFDRRKSAKLMADPRRQNSPANKGIPSADDIAEYAMR